MRPSVLLSLVLLLAACGQSGALYLPDDQSAAPAPAADSTTQEAPVTPGERRAGEERPERREDAR